MHRIAILVAALAIVLIPAADAQETKTVGELIREGYVLNSTNIGILFKAGQSAFICDTQNFNPGLHSPELGKAVSRVPCYSIPLE